MKIIDQWWDWAPTLVKGLGISVQITTASMIIGYATGLFLALVNMSGRWAPRTTALALIELCRGTPALVFMLMIYYGLPRIGPTWTGTTCAIIALSIVGAANSAEIFRAGLQSVPHGQVEAAKALALPARYTYRHILLPQGLRVSIPSLMSYSILLFQTSAMAYAIAVPELLSRAYSIGSKTFEYTAALSLAGVLYVAITIPAGWVVSLTERRLSRHL